MLEIDEGRVSYLEFCLLVTVTLVLDAADFSLPFLVMMEVKSELSESFPTSSPEPENCPPPPWQSDANERLSFLQEADAAVAGQWTVCLQTNPASCETLSQ